MMSSHVAFDRRRFLRGAGAFVALPVGLEVIADHPAAGAGRAEAPRRIAFLMFPNGVNWDEWRPIGDGDGFELPSSLRPLGAFRDRLQIFTGFAHRNSDPGEDGNGDHARAAATFLTGCRARKTAGADILLGPSVDQLAAREVGHLTRLPSLELGSEPSRRSGLCDDGYSCAYQYNLSWANERVPLPPESVPRRLFERLFGAGSAATRARTYEQRQRQRRSVLDFVREDARSMQAALGATDRRKVDEYFTSLRAIERQIEVAEAFPLPRAPLLPPTSVPEDHGAHIRLMCDLLALAFETDSTRIATFMLASEGSNRSFPEIGIPEGHHHLTHHFGDREKLAKVAVIDRFYVQVFAHLLGRLARARDVDGRSVLDNSTILYGCGMGDGNRHRHYDLPIILAGGGGGRLRPGRHVNVAPKTPLSNLLLTVLHTMDARVDRVGDSTGVHTDV